MSDQKTELELLFGEAPQEEEHVRHNDEDEDAPPPRRSRKKPHEHAISELNLTAMMDMMTIILVFLIKNYATTPESVTLSDELAPPRSTSKIPMDTAVTVTITKTSLLVDDKKVAVVKAATWSVDDENVDAKTPTINPLAESLDKRVADLKAIENKGGAPFEGKIMIVADQDVTYEMLMRVLYTAGLAQFSQYKLVVRSAVDNAVMHEGPH